MGDKGRQVMAYEGLHTAGEETEMEDDADDMIYVSGSEAPDGPPDQPRSKASDVPLHK